MTSKSCLLALSTFALVPFRVTAAEPIDLALARTYFAEARAVTSRDAGGLWGVRLDGPMLFVDPATRRVVANMADTAGKLAETDGVWHGTLPANQPLGNTPVFWSGIRWTMIMWPLPKDPTRRASLMAHELFHRVQTAAGLPPANPRNAHLEEFDGRYLLQLEWRALGRALQARGPARAEAVRDALTFRAQRRALWPRSALEENALERNEGLAEYTGVVLASASRAVRVALATDLLDGGPSRPVFARSFAYVSGPAYGLLLDDSRPSWRRDLASDSDLGALLGSALGVREASDLERAVASRAPVYGGIELWAAESRRASERAARLGEYRKRFVEAREFVIPLTRAQVSFDPNEIVPLGETGTVYPTMQAADEWGSVEVSGGALVSADWSTLTLGAPVDPASRPVRGDGWTLDLAPGWEVVPAERPGTFVLRRRS